MKRLLFALLLSAPLAVQAGEEPTPAPQQARATEVGADQADTRTAVENYFAGLESLSGDFTQQVFDGEGNLTEDSSGEFFLATPNRLRWHYAEPFEQLILADGEKVWLYDPDLEQVTVKDQLQNQANSPLVVLIRPETLEQHFASRNAGHHDGLDWLELTPVEEESQYERVVVGLEDAALREMRLVDTFGQTTIWRFDSLQPGAEIPADTFHFEPPEGIDIIGAEALLAEEPPPSAAPPPG